MSTQAPNDPPANTFELTVLRMRKGEQGNTPDGRYYYTFNPPMLMTTKPCQMQIVLTEETSTGLTLQKVITSAPAQFVNFQPAKEGKGMTFDNLASKDELVSIAVLMRDDLSPNNPIICDPQVINNPD